MPPFRLFSITPLILSIVMMTSCEDSEPSGREKRLADESFFSGVEPTLNVKDLKNEMAAGETDFLRSFKDDPIPWQRWNKDLLSKSEALQIPILAYVGGSIDGYIDEFKTLLAEDTEMKEIFSEQYLFSVIDVRVHPELESLCAVLSSDLRPVRDLPVLIWLSHQGVPMGWIPLSHNSEKGLAKSIKNSSDLVNSVWKEGSKYAIENSNTDLKIRQEEIDRQLEPNTEDPVLNRVRYFLRYCRTLSSLFDAAGESLDIGGNDLPLSQIRLFALGSQTEGLPAHVRKRCLDSFVAATKSLSEGAIKDHLEDNYFARKESRMDWSLPHPGKSLAKQLEIAGTYLETGNLPGHEVIFKEGVQLLTHLEKDWIGNQLALKAISNDLKEPGVLLWNFETLEEVLGPEELRLAVSAFSLERGGNIPAVTDPKRKFYGLNSLRREVPVSFLAKHFNSASEDQLETRLSGIIEKLRTHRETKIDYRIEKTLTLNESILHLIARTNLALANPSSENIAAAVSIGDEIKKDYYTSENGLATLATNESFSPAHCGEYARLIEGYLLLFRLTLDSIWLEDADRLATEVVTKFGSENQLLTQLSPDQRIIQLRQHDAIGLFRRSTLGLMELNFAKLSILLGTDRYDDRREAISNAISQFASTKSGGMVDFFFACALGDKPIVALLRGDPNSKSARSLTGLLNSPRYRHFLCLRPESNTEPLFALPSDLPSKTSEASITLLQDDKVLGQANTPDELINLLTKQLPSR